MNIMIIMNIMRQRLNTYKRIFPRLPALRFPTPSLPAPRFLTACLLALLLIVPLRMPAQAANAPISFDRASVHVKQGKTRNVRISCRQKYTVTSTDTSIATVTHSGKVKGKQAGSCEIIVTSGSESARLPVRVYTSLQSLSKEILYMGHRGYQDRYPENTLVSFRGALNYGAAGAEFDVWNTKSNDILVFHDSSLNRMCRRSGSIRKLTATTRRKYNAKAHGISAPIPTLEEALDMLSRQNAWAFVHLKHHGGPVFKGRSADHVAKCIRENDMTQRCVVFCSAQSTLKYFNKHHPDIMTGYFYDGSSTTRARACMRKAVHCGATWFFFYLRSGLNYYNVKYAHSLGLKVGLYRTLSQNQLLDMLDYGADFAMMYHKLI